MNGFYNLPSIFESLCNVAEIRLGLVKKEINLNGRKHDLYKILDDIVIYGCVNAKYFIKAIRGYLNFIVRFCGSRGDDPYTLRHVGFREGLPCWGESLEYQSVSSDLLMKFFKCDTMQKVYNDGRKVFEQWNMVNLDVLCESLLDYSLKLDSIDDFAIACSFFQSIMKIASFGRALKYSSAPVSAPEMKEDVHGVADEIFETYVELDRKAKAHGFKLVVCSSKNILSINQSFLC